MSTTVCIEENENLYTFPKNTKILIYGDNFNQPLDDVIFPSTLKTIFLGDSFNHSIDNVKFPKSLAGIVIGDAFNHPISGLNISFLYSMLTIGNAFNSVISNIPKNLRSISLGKSFNQSLAGVEFPPDLRFLYLFNPEYKTLLKKTGVNIPSRLIDLKIADTIIFLKPSYYYVSPIQNVECDICNTTDHAIMIPLSTCTHNNFNICEPCLINCKSCPICRQKFPVI
jgi:hypothetical protein